MKKLFVLTALVLCTCAVFAQGGWTRPANSYGIRDSRVAHDSILFYPTGCGAPTRLRGYDLHMGAIYYDSCGHKAYLYDPASVTWTAVSTGTPPNYWTLSGGNIYNNTGTNVGIGTSTPAYKLEVEGTGYFLGDLSTNGIITAENDLISNGDLEVVSGRIKLSNGYGTEGQQPTSHGTGAPPTWETPSGVDSVSLQDAYNTSIARGETTIQIDGGTGTIGFLSRDVSHGAANKAFIHITGNVTEEAIDTTTGDFGNINVAPAIVDLLATGALTNTSQVIRLSPDAIDIIRNDGISAVSPKVIFNQIETITDTTGARIAVFKGDGIGGQTDTIASMLISALGSGGGGSGTVAIVTGSAPVIITSTPTTTPNVTVDTGRGNPQLTTGYDLNKVRDSLQTNINAKGTGTVTSVAALTLGTTGTDLTSSVANGTTTPVITLNVPTASASNRGALSSADWTTFNNKGSGTVTSVSGTTNRITSTGGATPVIDISATFEALLGKVASPLSQFASTTSSQLAGVISDETGSGALVFGSTPTIATPSITTGFTIGGAATSRKLIVGNGTNFVPSTETWAVPGTSGNVLTSDGTNWTSAAPAASGVTTIGTFSATSIANGASISGSTLTLGAGDGTNPGMVSTTTQTFAGVKTLATPIFTTSAQTPLLIGGTGTTSTLTYKTTTGVGTTGADQIWVGGNNGATEFMRILNSGFVGIGTNAPITKLHLNLSGGTEDLVTVGNGFGAGMYGVQTTGVPVIYNYAAKGIDFMGNYNSTPTLQMSINSSGNLELVNKITKYNNVSTAGWGVPAIYGSGRSTGQTAAVASLATYTVPAADGSFIISANVLVTTSSAEAFTVTVAYTDEGNTARSQILPFVLLAGTTAAAINFANGATPYEGIPIHIRCKASTAITVATAGAFTGATYNAEATITQIK